MTSKEMLKLHESNIGTVNNNTQNENEVKNEIERIMFTDYSYINWILKTLDEYDKFIVRTKESNYALQYFNMFYNRIAMYADYNYIYPKIDEFTGYYTVRHKGVTFNVGETDLPDILFFCEKTDEKESVIEFRDIMLGRDLPRKAIIENELNVLLKGIDSLVEKGVPFSGVIEEIRNMDSMRGGKYIRKKVK